MIGRVPGSTTTSDLRNVRCTIIVSFENRKPAVSPLRRRRLTRSVDRWAERAAQRSRTIDRSKRMRSWKTGRECGPFQVHAIRSDSTPPVEVLFHLRAEVFETLHAPGQLVANDL